MERSYRDRIVVNPKILDGKPVIRGTRIPVEQVLEDLSEDLDVKTLMEAYPRLTGDDIKACLEYARALVAGETPLPIDRQADRTIKKRTPEGHEQFLSSAGSWKDVDTDTFLADVYESRRMKMTDAEIEALRASAGGWADFDADAFIKQVYRDREGSNPGPDKDPGSDKS